MKYWRSLLLVVVALFLTLTLSQPGRSNPQPVPTYSQSSVYSGTTPATVIHLTDANATTGAMTNSLSTGSWIRADFNAAVTVDAVTVGGGNIPGRTSIASYLNNAQIQYSLNGTDWVTVATVTGMTNTGTSTFKTYSFPAVTTRHWRLLRSGNLGTTEFQLRLLPTETPPSPDPLSPYSISQSGLFSGAAPGTYTNLTDVNSATGTLTSYAANPWIQADLGSPKVVSAVRVGGGNIPGRSGIASYLNNAQVQYSTDGLTWYPAVTITGITNSGDTVFKTYEFYPRLARYWRLTRAGSSSLGTTEFLLNPDLIDPDTLPDAPPLDDTLNLYKDIYGRLYIQGLAPNEMIKVVYQNLFRRVTIRPNANRCNLYQFWNTSQFSLYTDQGVTIYLPPGMGTVNFKRDQVLVVDDPVCVDGMISPGLNWTPLGDGIEAIAAYVQGWNRYRPEDETFMILVRGLPSQGLYATDHSPASRFGKADSCGIARFSTTPTYNNDLLGTFHFYKVRGDWTSENYRWNLLRTYRIPPVCRDGIIYQPAS